MVNFQNVMLKTQKKIYLSYSCGRQEDFLLVDQKRFWLTMFEDSQN